MNAIDIGKLAPSPYQAMSALSKQSEVAATAVGLDPLIIELVKIRVSQINGCAFCLRMHAAEAVKQGESADRLAVIAAWWESQYFSPAEQEALAIAERVTNLARPHESHSMAGEGVLNDEQIAAVTWVAIVINSWNRIAVSSHYPVAP